MTNFQNWLIENKTFILPSLIFILIFTVICLAIWANKVNSQKVELVKIDRQLWEKTKKLDLRKTELTLEKKKIDLYFEELQKKEGHLVKFGRDLFEKEKTVAKQLEINFQKEHEWQKANNFLIKKQQEIDEKIKEIAQINKEEARQILFTQLKREIGSDLDQQTRQEIKKYQERLEKESTNIICLALERYSTDLIFNKTVNFLTVDSKKILSKIIGKDGKNINFFRKITGTDIVIDQGKEEQKDQEVVLEISSFNSLRREIATRTLKRLIAEQKITPLYIEKVFQEISKEVEKIIQQSGEEVCQELQLNNIHPELIKYLGKLKFRTSYGQNVLEHCLEVAKLAGFIAKELGLDSELAKRSGLLHDIGKVIEGDNNESHVTNGIALAKQYGESEIVINAIASHHRDFPADNFYSLIVSAADTLSAARPGARGQQLETYLARMEKLESLVEQLPGVKKIHAFQAGREIWVLVDAQKIGDHQMWELSREVKKQIQEQVIIPGDITISLLRERKITQKLINSGRPDQNVINSQEGSKQPRKRPKKRKKA